jgi:hypothetical protein
MRVWILPLAAILICAAVPAVAQTVTEPREPAPQQSQDGTPSQTQEGSARVASSRYSFTRVENGFLRLDSENGQVSYCSAQSAGWTCQAVPEERAAFETEIARLQNEVASLKKEIAALKEPLPPRPPADLKPRGDKSEDLTIKLPTQEELARVRAFIEETWRRLVDMVMMRKD